MAVEGVQMTEDGQAKKSLSNKFSLQGLGMSPFRQICLAVEAFPFSRDLFTSHHINLFFPNSVVHHVCVCRSV